MCGKLIVELKNVTKSYAEDGMVLAGIDLDIPEGLFLSLLGPSGCGKSTLLRLIAGLEAPSTGVITRTEAASYPGFVFQDATLMPWASVFDNVFLPLRLRGVRKSAAYDTVMDALDRVGLADYAHFYPAALSGGMKMRVSIARALLSGARLYLMDEPFAALDEITRFKLNDELLALRQELGWTVIFVTHSVYESVYLSDRIAVMSASPGRITTLIDVEWSGARRDFRHSLSYHDVCENVSQSLAGAMGG